MPLRGISALTMGLISGLTLQAQADFFINEFHYDNASTDVDEFIEVVGPAGTDLSGATLVLYNGSSSSLSPYSTLSLGGILADQCDGYGTSVVTLPTNGIQNGGPDGIALVDASGSVFEFISYEGSFTAVAGPASGMTSVDIGVSESSSTAAGSALQLIGSGFVAADFSWTGPAPASQGQCNQGQSFSASEPPATPDVFLSELHYDNAGSDIGEAIELRGPAGTNLTGWTIEFYNGSNGSVYDTINLSGTFPAQCDNGEGTLAFFESGIQNGAPDGLALVDGNGAVVQFLSYEGVLTATDGAAVGETSVDIGVTEISSTPEGFSLQLNDGNWQPPQEATFGLCNEDEVQPPEPEMVFVHEVQGSGSDSPLVGTTVTIEAIVVGDFQDDAQLNGFFVQEEDNDADASSATAEGIFVYCGSCDVDVVSGDKLSLTGSVSEFFGLTQITSFTDIVIVAGNQTLPSATVISDIGSTDLESLEGMRVNLPGPLTVAYNFNMRFGEIGITDQGILTQPTQTMLPGPDAFAQETANSASLIVLDDGSTLSNPDPIVYAADGGPLSSSNTVRAGDTLGGIEAVVSYGFSRYRLQPIAPVDIGTTNPRPAIAPLIAGNLRVASFNVLNYFTTLDQRGADTAAEFDRQREKLLTALSSIDAEIIGIVEVENDLGTAPDEALVDIVSGLNDMASGAWSHIATGKIGTDAIKVGFIYRSDVITPVGPFAILDSSVDSDFVDTKNRPALAQTFSLIDSHESLTVVVNHFKSKGSNCNDLGDPDVNDGQANCNLTRTLAATALTNWVAGDPTGTGETDVLLIGDFNAYAKEDPIVAMETAGFINLEELFEPDGYSYTFDGQRGTLDYGLASGCLVNQAVGTAVWHINADEPSILDYNLDSGRDPDLFDSNTPYRSSDHDPLIMGFDLSSFEVRRKTGAWRDRNSIGPNRRFVNIGVRLFDGDRPARGVRGEVEILSEGEVVSSARLRGRVGNFSARVRVSTLDSGTYGVVMTLDGCQQVTGTLTIR